MAPRPVAFDINHNDACKNGHDVADFKKAYAAGYRAVVLKCTQGASFVDPFYVARVARARAAGFLVGAYHYQERGDAGGQVSFFLAHVAKALGGALYTPPTNPDDEKRFVRLVLDFEADGLGLWQCESFLDVMHIATQQAGWLYGGGLLKDLLQKRGSGAELAQYPLWLAEYSTVARVPRMWKNYVLWQRSGDGQGPGPHDIPGIGVKQDVDYFDGTDQELKAAWYGQIPT